MQVQKKELFSNRNIWFIYLIIIANAPDFDFIPEVLTGEQYHHGISHSLFFAILFSLVITLTVKFLWESLYLRLFLLNLLLYAAHLFMDFFTEGGVGIPLLWPFTDTFFISPISIFPGVHHSRGIIDPSHLTFITLEAVYSALLMGGLWIWKKVRLSS